jgi:hypothetical protein
VAACLKCPMTATTGQMSIPPNALAAEPALAVLCPDHFKDFIKARDAATTRAHREANRIWCDGCGQEKYLDRPGPCERCRNPFRGSQNVLAGNHPIKIQPEWYSISACDTAGCDAKLVYRLPDGRELCVAHGAPSRAGAQETAGRS